MKLKMLNKKYQIALLVIAIMLIISGVSYAYFAVIATGTSNNNIVTSGTMKIKFTDGPEISLENAIPGDSLTKTFTVENTGTVNTTYDIYLSDVVNTFADKTDLVYTLKSDTGANITEETALPSDTVKIVSMQSINVNEKQSYTLTIKFLNKDEQQDDNQGKIFKGKITVVGAGQTVGSGKDYTIASYVDGVASNFPAKDTGYTVSSVDCTNGATGEWNYGSWGLYVSNNTQTNTVCSVYFNTAVTYVDDSGASYPELYQGMIPVTIDNGIVKVADTSQNWYDYTTHDWANAVLIDCSDLTIKDKYFNNDMSIKQSAVNQVIDMTDILEMYVWIPRYKYLLWNAANGSSNPKAISIAFEDKDTPKSTGTSNGTYLTHPAFTFGNTELNGIWVGKFETSGTISALTIKPNMTSLTNLTVGDMFNASRNTDLIYSSTYGLDSSEVDNHLMKNMEWGAVAYLSSSIYGRYNTSSACISSGCEIWINNVNTYASGSYGPSITGCSGASVSASISNSMSACASGHDWSTLGINASTTGNEYGIYDMSGGDWDIVMGNMVDSSGKFYPSASGLTTVGSKYYDSYTYSTSLTDHNRGKLGDAIKETLQTYGNVTGGWNSDYAVMIINETPWFNRGGFHNDTSHAGAFAFYRANGSASPFGGFHTVLTAE